MKTKVDRPSPFFVLILCLLSYRPLKYIIRSDQTHISDQLTVQYSDSRMAPKRSADTDEPSDSSAIPEGKTVMQYDSDSEYPTNIDDPSSAAASGTLPDDRLISIKDTCTTGKSYMVPRSQEQAFKSFRDSMHSTLMDEGGEILTSFARYLHWSTCPDVDLDQHHPPITMENLTLDPSEGEVTMAKSIAPLAAARLEYRKFYLGLAPPEQDFWGRVILKSHVKGDSRESERALYSAMNSHGLPPINMAVESIGRVRSVQSR